MPPATPDPAAEPPDAGSPRRAPQGAEPPREAPQSAEPQGAAGAGYERFAASLAGRWAAFATRAPCASVELVGEATAAIFPAAPTRGIFNNALLTHGAADPAATLRALRRAYARAGVARFAVWLRADDHATLAAAAANRWRATDTTTAMIATLPAPAPGGDGSRVVEVTETAEICLLNEVEADLLSAWPERARAYLVRDAGGRALSAAVATRHDDDCALSFVATLPQARRQGHAGRTVARLLADAAAAGCTTATLSATPVAERLYRALGFRDLCRMVVLQPL